MKVPPNTHEYCSRTNPRKISCQNDTRLYDKGTKTSGLTKNELYFQIGAEHRQWKAISNGIHNRIGSAVCHS